MVNPFLRMMMIFSRTCDPTGRDRPAFAALILVGAVLLLMVLSACAALLGTVSVKIDTTCDWFKDQRLSPRTKAWLRTNPVRESYDTTAGVAGTRFPAYVRRDLARIGANNRLAVRFCPDVTADPKTHWSGDPLSNPKTKLKGKTDG